MEIGGIVSVILRLGRVGLLWREEGIYGSFSVGVFEGMESQWFTPSRQTHWYEEAA